MMKPLRPASNRGIPLELARIFKAFATNQLARLAPQTYVRLTRQTGRGDPKTETPEAIAGYFRRCVADYFDVLGIPASQQQDFLRDKVVLEYGPGDMPGVALLLVAMGARKVYCVDRSPLVRMGEKNVAVIQQLAVDLSADQRQRLLQCLLDPLAPAEGFSQQWVEYLVKPDGLCGMTGEVDLVISRAVLEHVNDLESTCSDMCRAMRPGSMAVHQVDLKSHGLHRSNPLDFLEYPTWLWNLMYSHKGVPNRWRVDHYRKILAKLPLDVVDLNPTALFDEDDVAKARIRLAEPFRGLGKDDLAWQGFWLACRKRP